jgi:hypothetical protein
VAVHTNYKSNTINFIPHSKEVPNPIGFLKLEILNPKGFSLPNNK